MKVAQPRWSHASAVFGTVAWLALLLVPARGEVGIGTIERLFLLAPLVLVPLAFAMVWPGGAATPSRMERIVIAVQPFAAVLAAGSFLFPQGKLAAALAAPWTILCLVVGVCGLVRIVCGPRQIAALCFHAAFLMLPIGGIGFVQSRFGATPLDFHEPWVLLVAVHFHYAAFVAPIIVGALGNHLEERVLARAAFGCAATGVIIGSPLMASGFMFHLPWLRAVAAFILTLSLAIQAILTLLILPAIRPRFAQGLLALSAASVLVAMAYAILFTLGDCRDEVWVSIPQMARTHGILNAFGFSLCGLLGWNLAAQEQRHAQRFAAQRRPQTLLSRWE